MIDLASHELELTCPKCRFYNYATLRSVIERDVIICRGCKANVLLDDHLNTARRAVREIEAAFRQLETVFGALGGT